VDTVPPGPDKDDEAVLHAQAAALSGPRPGTLHQHYKGGVYRTVGPAVLEATLEPATLYRGTRSPVPWVRTLNDWRAVIALPDGSARPRFLPTGAIADDRPDVPRRPAAVERAADLLRRIAAGEKFGHDALIGAAFNLEWPGV
jgi:hypothetical protein